MLCDQTTSVILLLTMPPVLCRVFNYFFFAKQCIGQAFRLRIFLYIYNIFY